MEVIRGAIVNHIYIHLRHFYYFRNLYLAAASYYLGRRCLPPATCYLADASCYLAVVSYYLLAAIYYIAAAIYYLVAAMDHLVTYIYHLSATNYYISAATSISRHLDIHVNISLIIYHRYHLTFSSYLPYSEHKHSDLYIFYVAAVRY